MRPSTEPHGGALHRMAALFYHSVRAALRCPVSMFACWGMRALSALLLASPLAAVLGVAVSQTVTGDAALFEPGALLLIEVLRLHGAMIAAAVGSSAALFCGLALLNLIPLVAVLVALDRTERPVEGAFMARVFAALPGCIVVGGATLLAQVLVATLLGLMVDWVLRAEFLGWSVQTREMSALALCLVGLLLSVTLWLGQDLARASLISHRHGTVAAVGSAWLTLRARPALTLTAWLVPGLLGFACVLLAAWALGSWWLASPWWTFLLHQPLVLLAVWLRGVWLAAALRLVQG